MCQARSLTAQSKLLQNIGPTLRHPASFEWRATLTLDTKRQTDFTSIGSRYLGTEIGPSGEQQSALKLSHSANVTCHTRFASAS